MVLNPDEAIDLITNLLLIHVPNSLDRQNVLENLRRELFITPPGKCRTCGKAMVCPDCDDIDVWVDKDKDKNKDVDVTVRLGGRIIHA